MRTERFRGALLSALLLASLMAPVASLLSAGSASAQELVPRDPIYIEGNENFTAANGAVAGSGTENDPYIIENWDINTENANGIEIRNTTAHFIIRNCYVHDGKSRYNYGIYFGNVTNGKIDNVRVDTNLWGIRFNSSPNNTVTNSTLLNNEHNFGVWGEETFHYHQRIDTSNKINGKPIYYLVGQENLTFDEGTTDIGYLGLVSSKNIRIQNLNISNNGDGILLVNTSYSTIKNCDLSNNYMGIHLHDSSNNTIQNCTTSKNKGGFYIYRSSNNIFKNCTAENGSSVYAGTGNGFIFFGSDNNIIEDSIAKNNSSGIVLDGSSDNNQVLNFTAWNNTWYGIVLSGLNNRVENSAAEHNHRGIVLEGSSNNLITESIASNNNTGVWVIFSDNNVIRNCTLEKNGYGIYIHPTVYLPSDNNRVFHNNFKNNENQASDGGSNYWDDGYPSGGNYWSDYTGEDNYRGENQDIPGSDGIGDTPYDIPQGANRDRYPLMNPVSAVTKPSPVRWPLIAGIVGVIVIIGIVAALYMKRVKF